MSADTVIIGLLRVQFGKRLQSQTISKTKAAKTEPYLVFVNVNGHFKRRSVFKPKS